MLELKGLKHLSKISEEKTINYEHNIIMVPIEFLYSSKLQPRNIFVEKDLKELADNISQNGILQPIITRKVNNKYEIIAGERRWRAATLAGLSSVPIVVREYDDQKTMLVALAENLQREDLSALEEARAYDFLAKSYALTHEKIAELIAKPRVTITNTLRLLSLGDLAKSYLVDGSINAGHARALLALSGKDQDLAVQFVIDKKLNVRQTEQYIKNFTKKSQLSSLFYDKNQITELQSALNYKLNKQIEIKQNSKNEKIKVTIEFDNLDDAENFFELAGLHRDN